MAQGGNKRSRAKPPADAPAPADDADAGGSVDEILDGLEEVVHELEQGDLPLEQALVKFEHGVRLARRGGAKLAAIEERVEVLLADRESTAPFDGDEDDDDER